MVSGGVSRHHVLALLTAAALALGGLVQQSTTVAVLATSVNNSSELAEYVANASSLARHCAELYDNNSTDLLLDANVTSDEANVTIVPTPTFPPLEV